MRPRTPDQEDLAIYMQFLHEIIAAADYATALPLPEPEGDRLCEIAHEARAIINTHRQKWQTEVADLMDTYEAFESLRRDSMACL